MLEVGVEGEDLKDYDDLDPGIKVGHMGRCSVGVNGRQCWAEKQIVGG